jgi:hypothetical protein
LEELASVIFTDASSFHALDPYLQPLVPNKMVRSWHVAPRESDKKKNKSAFSLKEEPTRSLRAMGTTHYGVVPLFLFFPG